MVLKKLAVSVLCFQLIFSNFLSEVSALETENNNPINWISMYGNVGNSSITPDSINDAAITNDNIIAAGTFDGNKVTDVENMKGKSDAAIMLYDKNGEQKWETLVGGSAADTFNSVIVSSNGGYVAVGTSQSSDGDLENISKGSKDGVVAKFDNSGNLEKIVTIGGSDTDELKDVIMTYDRGYLAVGYSHSTDGDLENLNKGTDRDAIIVKLDKDLNIEWIDRAGGSGGDAAVKKMDEFSSVMTSSDGGYLAVGYSNSTDGDLENISKGSKDALMVKYSSDGTKEWVKTYGGLDDDVFTSIAKAHNKSTSSDKDETDEQNTDGGYILSGTTSSTDNIFENLNTTGTDNAFILRVDSKGEMIWVDTLENSEKASGKTVLTNRDGFVMAGTYSENDNDFVSQKSYGKEDMFIAYYSEDGALLNMYTFGGEGKDTVNGLLRTDNSYFLYGNTASNENIFENLLQGKYDGFVASIDKDAIESYADEKYIAPVKAWKANADELSMMAPLLYKDAYVEKKGNQYNVTIYFTNASIMGTQVSASTLGDVSYEYNGEMLDAQKDEYDETTQVKSVTIKAKDLDNPILLKIEDAMGDIRIVFDTENMVETSNPPYFAPVEVTQPDFGNTWKINIGGTDTEYTNDMTVLENGNIIVVGETYSNDNDFQNRLNGASSAFINEYNQKGNLLNTTLLGGTEFDSYAYASSVVSSKDGGYVVSGGYREGYNVDPTGDFAQLSTENSVHGLIDGFIAKYDSNHKLIWMNNFSGSSYDQVKQLKSTSDGGVVALIETNSTDGDMENENKGLYDLAIVKYSADGKKEWQRGLGGKSMESAGFGIDILEDGSYIISGSLGSKSGDFSDVTYYGDVFDIFAAKISPEGKLLWTKAYGGDKNEYTNGVISTSDGGFIMLGNTKSTTDTFQGVGTSYDNAFVIKCDAQGEVQWKDVIKSSEYSELSRGIEVDGEYVFLGQSRGTDFDFKNINKGSMDVFVTIYDKSGNRKSLETIGGSSTEYASSICLLNDYQISLLMYGDSTDGDMKDLNRGDFDGTLLTYDYKEKSEAPGDTEGEEEQPETPGDTEGGEEEQPETPGDTEGVEEEQPETPGDIEGGEEEQPETPGDTEGGEEHPETPGHTEDGEKEQPDNSGDAENIEDKEAVDTGDNILSIVALFSSSILMLIITLYLRKNRKVNC